MNIINGLVFDLKEGFKARELYTDQDRIAERSGDDRTIDASGCYIIPGLVDLHFHGAVGEDFSDASPEGLQKIAEYQLSEGVTYICPASMTLPEDQLTAICRNAASHRRNASSGAELVGIHLEGPFLSMAKKGAQNGEFLHAPDTAMLRRLQQAAEGAVKLVTIAPEEPGGMDFVRNAVQDGITVSVGHTTADYETAAQAYRMGASHATHLYNGMPSHHHREPAVIGAAFDAPHVKAELICDGIHLHPATVRMAFQLFTARRIILISDSLRATGMPDGTYPFGGQEIEVCGNRATIAGHPETLAGSVTSLMGCVRKAVELGIPLADAIRAASFNPAEVLKIDHRAGSLDIGKEASMVLLNQKDLSIRTVIFKGQEVKHEQTL